MNTKRKALQNIRRFELVNRLFCLACVVPFFYTASCLGQQKNIPTKAKVGSVGFVASAIAAFAIRNKEEKIQKELENTRA